MWHRYHETGRHVLKLAGDDPAAFLQGLVTNDVAKTDEGQLVYTALLTPQGKYLFDFFMFSDDSACYLDVSADRSAALIQRLTLYKLRRQIEIEITSLEVGLLWSGDPVTAPELPGMRMFPDSRSTAMGYRVYGMEMAQSLANIQGAEPGTSDTYTAHRVALAVPEAGLELIPDQTFILEAGFEALHGVDFRKGCYVGQEVTARMKHKTSLRRGLYAVEIAGEAMPGEEVTRDGKAVGQLHSVIGPNGLATLRHDRIGDGMMSGTARISVATPIPAKT